MCPNPFCGRLPRFQGFQAALPTAGRYAYRAFGVGLAKVGATGLEPIQAVALTSLQLDTSSNNLCCSLALHPRAMWHRVALVLYGIVQHGGTIDLRFALDWGRFREVQDDVFIKVR